MHVMRPHGPLGAIRINDDDDDDDDDDVMMQSTNVTSFFLYSY